MPSGDPGSLGNVEQPKPAPEPAPRAQDPIATVDGEPVTEFRALVGPLPAALISREGGTATISRVYVDERGIDVAGEGPGRAIGGFKPVAIRFSRTTGLEVQLEKGWHFWAPVSLVQACWKA